MCYDNFQQYYYNNWTIQWEKKVTGIIGTTLNGITYLSTPFLFALFTTRWARQRQLAALCSTFLGYTSFILASFSRHVWHLVIIQGILAALGGALIFTPLTISLGEWFNTENRVRNRAVAYGIVLSSKDIVGPTCPFLFRGLLDIWGFRTTLRIWAGITLGSGILAILMVPTPPSSMARSTSSPHITPWKFPKLYIYAVATMLSECRIWHSTNIA